MLIFTLAVSHVKPIAPLLQIILLSSVSHINWIEIGVNDFDDDIDFADIDFDIDLTSLQRHWLQIVLT